MKLSKSEESGMPLHDTAATTLGNNPPVENGAAPLAGAA